MLNIAVLGGTGAVGIELLKILEEREFPIGSQRLLASARSAGKKVPFKGEEIEVQEAGKDSFAGVDLAFFCAGGGVSQELAQAAVDAGAIVVDNTSAFRMDPKVPLVVPEVNREALRSHQGIIANPNCSTIIMLVALAPIHRAVGLTRVVASTYQAVSGAGYKAIMELEAASRAYLEGQEHTPMIFPHSGAAHHHPIAFNLIPQIDVFGDDGYTKEEWKMVKETRKILGLPELSVAATTVRVPVFRCHSESVLIETREKLTPERCREILATAPGVEVLDQPQEHLYPMPLALSGTDSVYVGRIREDLSSSLGLHLWIVGDQIRKGAALNAVQIGEALLEDGLV